MKAVAEKVGVALCTLLLLAACGSSSPKMSPATAKADISRSYAAVFNFSNKSVSAKTSVIENGSSLKKAIAQALSSSLAKTATGAQVVSVKLLGATACSQAALPSPCAVVTYNLLGTNRKPLFTTPSSGYAVFVSGKWLVAKSTICGLLELFYSASGRSGTPPGCQGA